MIDNKYNANSRFFISYEVGVMIAVIEEHPTNFYVSESVERICKNIKLNSFMVAEGIYNYGKENFNEYTEEEINELLVQYGLGKLEYI